MAQAPSRGGLGARRLSFWGPPTQRQTHTPTALPMASPTTFPSVASGVAEMSQGPEPPPPDRPPGLDRDHQPEGPGELGAHIPSMVTADIDQEPEPEPPEQLGRRQGSRDYEEQERGGGGGGSQEGQESLQEEEDEQEGCGRSPHQGPSSEDQAEEFHCPNFSTQQLEELERIFQHNHYPSPMLRRDLARSMDVSASQLRVWFKNRRAKWRKRQRVLQLRARRHQRRAQRRATIYNWRPQSQSPRRQEPLWFYVVSQPLRLWSPVPMGPVLHAPYAAPLASPIFPPLFPPVLTPFPPLFPPPFLPPYLPLYPPQANSPGLLPYPPVFPPPGPPFILPPVAPFTAGPVFPAPLPPCCLAALARYWYYVADEDVISPDVGGRIP
ncbi:homeobox protein ESX1-like [Erinaceus europaeus]|uniref:Homeobox protein ESX1-like n=1 Tax=Erinaceus europaeus TaxID=9365 RepID=A0ABM3WQ61_ERIEU|nr:homeobox protein ESX1-like [Erinaceus europaeus]